MGVGVPAVADTDLAAWSTCLLSHSESLAGLPRYNARRAGLAPSRGSEQSPRPRISQGLQAPVLLPPRSKLAVAGGGGLGLLSLWSSLFCLLVPVRTLVMTRGRLHAPPSLLAWRPSSSQALGVTSLVAVPPSPTGDEGVVPQSPASLFPETCFLKRGWGLGTRGLVWATGAPSDARAPPPGASGCRPSSDSEAACPDRVSLGETKQGGRCSGAARRAVTVLPAFLQRVIFLHCLQSPSSSGLAGDP